METANNYITSEVDDSNLDQIQEDLENKNELIAYEHDKDRNVVKCVLDLSDFQIDLGYIY